MDDGTAQALQKWKAHRFRPAELPFADAVESLGEPGALIEARLSPTRKSDWVICRAGTYSPAVFVYAAVFAEADPDYETGNLLWGKAPVPDGADEGRFIRYAGYKAAYSYAIETYHDKEFWHLMGKLDAYVETVSGFNARELPRRAWQNGDTWHGRYYLRSPMFLTCEARGGRPDPPAGLHEWVVAAHQKSKTYRANPVRPLVCGLNDGRLDRISNCTPSRLEYGDVVSLVFGLTYVEDRDDWGPVPTVTHVIRVQRANRDVYQLASQLRSVGIEDDVGAMPLGMLVDGDVPPAGPPLRNADVRTDQTGVGAGEGGNVAGSSETVDSGAYGGHGRPSGNDGPSREAGEGSASEMDVDDDDAGGVQGLAGAELVAVHSDGGASSGGSTLTEVSSGEDAASGPPQTPAKKRRTGVAASEAEVDEHAVATGTRRSSFAARRQRARSSGK